jgi:hypothetical protein
MKTRLVEALGKGSPCGEPLANASFFSLAGEPAWGREYGGAEYDLYRYDAAGCSTYQSSQQVSSKIFRVRSTLWSGVALPGAERM